MANDEMYTSEDVMKVLRAVPDKEAAAELQARWDHHKAQEDARRLGFTSYQPDDSDDLRSRTLARWDRRKAHGGKLEDFLAQEKAGLAERRSFPAGGPVSVPRGRVEPSLQEVFMDRIEVAKRARAQGFAEGVASVGMILKDDAFVTRLVERYEELDVVPAAGSDMFAAATRWMLIDMNSVEHDDNWPWNLLGEFSDPATARQVAMHTALADVLTEFAPVAP